MNQLCDEVYMDGAPGRVRGLGSAHSFTPLVSASAESVEPTTIISLRKMPRKCDLDEQSMMLTVDAGSTYSEVCSFLRDTAYALPNTASLPQFSVAGALATGTHGSSGRYCTARAVRQTTRLITEMLLTGLDTDGRVALGALPAAAMRLQYVDAEGEVQSIARGEPGFDSSVVSLGMAGLITEVCSPT